MKNKPSYRTATGKTKKKYLLLRLWEYMSRYRLLIVCAAVLMLVSNIFALLGPKLSGDAIDAIGTKPGGVDFPTVFYYVKFMLLFYVLSAVSSYALSLIIQKIGRRMSYEMRKDVFDKLVSLPVGFFDQHQAGDIISIISYDVDTANSSLSNDFLQVCQSAVIIIGSFIMMLTIAPVLVLVFAVTIPVSVVWTRYITGRVHPLFRKRSKKLGELNGFVEEMIGGQKTTKAYRREEAFLKRFDVKNDEAVDAYTTSEYYGTITGPSVNFINNASLALVSVFGAFLYFLGSIGIGDISSFVLYSRRFSGPINEIANILGDLQSAFAAAERIFRLLDELPEKEDDKAAAVLKDVYGDVLIDNVSFGYTPEKMIIKNLNLHAEKGNLIAIVGPTGAGKTTIINLLMRFYDVQQGDILVDGQSIYSLTRESLRKAYTMVLQDTWLFGGTVFENIAYGKENVTREEVVQAAKAAKIHDFIEALPNGYDTMLTDNGINISKGQKQLLTIARAMLLDSKMLILDEATSNVDTQTERAIQDAMRKLMADKTCFVIAHRLSTIQHADLILVVKDGNVVEQGVHDELLAKRGAYFSLYNSQFDTYD
jgi:ATP-binding cassette subfamily B multidrug efflux pump